MIELTVCCRCRDPSRMRTYATYASGFGMDPSARIRVDGFPFRPPRAPVGMLRVQGSIPYADARDIRCTRPFLGWNPLPHLPALVPNPSAACLRTYVVDAGIHPACGRARHTLSASGFGMDPSARIRRRWFPIRPDHIHTGIRMWRGCNIC